LDLNSDDSSVLFTLNTIPQTRSKPPKLFNASTDHLKFHNLVNQGIKLNVKLKSSNDIDLAINNFTNLIQSAAWSSNLHTQHPLNQTSVPSDIRILIADKKRARAFFQRNHLPSLKHNYNKLSNLLKKMLTKHKASLLEKFLTNLSPNDGSL